jgi:hypothetical protein
MASWPNGCAPKALMPSLRGEWTTTSCLMKGNTRDPDVPQAAAKATADGATIDYNGELNATPSHVYTFDENDTFSGPAEVVATVPLRYALRQHP